MGKKENTEELKMDLHLTSLVDRLGQIAEGSSNKIYQTIKTLSDDIIERDDMDGARKAILRLLRDFAKMNDQLADATVKSIVAGAEEEVKDAGNQE
jgi:hypothetical protein